MNLSNLLHSQPQYDAFMSFSKAFQIGAVWIQTIGFELNNQQLKLYALVYDEERSHEDEEYVTSRRNKRPKTNREWLVKREGEQNNPFMNIKMLEINGQTYKVEGASSSGVIEGEDWTKILQLNEYMKQGFIPDSRMEHISLETMYFTEVEIEGTYGELPFVHIESIQCMMRDEWKPYPIRKKLTLEVGKDYPRAYTLGKGEERITFYIHEVALMDVAEEMEKLLSHPRFGEGIPAEQIEQIKADMRKQIKEVCPEGMKLPTITYEAESVTLQLYDTTYLNSAPETGNGHSMGFIMKPDIPYGKHGLSLRIATLQAPVSPDTKQVEVEILEYAVHSPGKTFTL